MSAFDRYFHGSFRGLRAYVLSKLFLAMVALDTWMLMIGHAGRYGVARFNVAHFSWLDRLGPVPSPALYVGVLLLTGLVALSLALLGVSRWPMTALFLLYTYSWTMSMLDSYQHHYFVSLVMLCMIFFPPLRAADVLPNERAQPRLTQGFGYNMLGATVCILYTFTSIAKMDAQWCQGYTLQRISTSAQVFAPILSLAAQLGMPAQRTWAFVSTSVIPLELFVALAYALAVRQDVTEHRWLRVLVGAGFVLALSLHLGAEALGLDIGWFSYYMLALAATYLLPGPAVDLLGQLFARPANMIARFLDEPDARPKSRFEVWITTAAASGILIAAAYMIDLPGSRGAAVVAVLGLWAWVAASVRHKRSPAYVALGAGVAAVLMWVAIARSEVRWDFYRFLGGDLQRRGEKEAALDAYLKGERYAPPGGSRRDKIKQLQRELGR